jgi:hypothetical protein
MAIPIVAVILGILFLVMLTAKAGAVGWVIFGIAAVIGLIAILVIVGRRHQHPSELDAPVVKAHAPGDGTFRLLVISDGTSTSSAFREQVAGRARGRPAEVLVVVPALGGRLAHWTGDDQARQEAETSLGETVAALTGAGVAARAEIGADDPIQAADDALREFPADEIVFATHPDDHANWKEKGVVEIARNRYGLPVAQTAVDPD